MKIFLFNFGMIFSMMFFFMNHPLSLGFMLLIQTLWISFLIGSISKTFWFSYILFLTFLGGMLILFIYMTSLSSNEMFKFSFNHLIFFMVTIMMIFLFIYNKDFFFFNYFNNMDTMIQHIPTNINSLYMNKLYNFPNNLLSIFMIIYLLLTLIIVVKITELFYGPLRKNF
uniref:NADH dehydrogenase subunit 6 n=1 Tax=Leptopsylla segnis TaxID=360617 RepID=UPI0023F02ABE|nr:NADH dehydrogenase subunit 6 [Leptopsylla segnis]WEF75055.1 NADH dehydrogenase subunit 6 [Leptopsylla segnis]